MVSRSPDAGSNGSAIRHAAWTLQGTGSRLRFHDVSHQLSVSVRRGPEGDLTVTASGADLGQMECYFAISSKDRLATVTSTSTRAFRVNQFDAASESTTTKAQYSPGK